ncbi:MAG: universal stress protein [Oligoflexia bacterium]|nr:universal stress protein [Oligoflexia bacterium]
MAVPKAPKLRPLPSQAIRPILVADDLGGSTPSGQQRSRLVEIYGEYLGAALQAPVLAVHVERSALPSLASSAFFRSKSRPVMPETSRDGPGESFRRRIVGGIPSQEILKLSRMRPPPLVIVMGTRARAGLKRLLLGGVAEKVIQSSRRPVMTVGPALLGPPPRNPFLPEARAELLVATDLGSAGTQVEAFALTLAMTLGAGVTLFHSPFNDEKLYAKIGAPLTRTGPLSGRIRALLEKRREPFLRAGVRCDAALDEETVFIPQAINRAASRFTAVVLGTHSRSSFAKALIGSTAREVILDSPVPVFTLSLRK